MTSNDILKELNNEEREYVLSVLKEISTEGKSDKYTELLNADYSEYPVDINTFMHDRKYLGNALYNAEGKFTVFPYWEKKLNEIFPTPTTTAYNTVVLTGAIGLGKSTIAVICLLYMLYRLLCLKDPYIYYGLQPIDKISISLVNITLDNAKGVALDKMNQMILSSDWFMSHGKMTGISNLIYEPDKHIEVITASSNNQIIGRALFCSFEDEVNFGLTGNIEKLKKKQKTLIAQVDARMKSRFLRGTYLPTLNIIASSKNSDQSFLEDFIDSKRKNESKNTLIVDEPQWVVDSRKDTPEKFYVAVGNKFLANEILPFDATEELADEYRAKGYTILKVPIGYKENFLENIDDALTDIAGIATTSSLKFISGIRWNECVNTNISNPFTKEVIEVGDRKEDKTQYKDFFDITKVPIDLMSKPMYIHLDMSISGDKTGIAGTWIVKKTIVADLNDNTAQSKSLSYRVAFSVGVKAPKGAQISFEKTKQFIYWLREQGFNIKMVTSDTFQSAPVLQDLRAQGFECSILSVDRLTGETGEKICEPYHYFRSTIYDKRLEIYKTRELTDEVTRLEKLSDGHVDHPTDGAKDISDAVCGSIFEASKHAEEYAYNFGEEGNYLIESNSQSFNNEMNIELENMMKEMFSPQSIENIRQEQNSHFQDFGMGKASDVSDMYAANGILIF